MGFIDKLFGGRKIKFVGLQELARVFGGGAWATSKLIHQYEKSLYVFAAINKIAQKISAIDLKLFQIVNSKGEVQDIPSHEVLDLLYRPNPFQTRSEFWKITTINKKLTGEAFWYKVRNQRGQVVELWNLRPDFMVVVPDEQTFIKRYEFQKLDGTKDTFEPSDIIHFKEPNPLDIYRGLSPLKPSQSRIQTEEYATGFQRDFFLNNARPDALLISEDELDAEQRDQLRVAWDTKHRGRGKNSRIGILEGGMQYQQVSVTQKEMDYIESLKFTRDDILVAFGVPKSVITTDDVNLANANSGLRTFLSETIKPEISALVEVINEMLVTPDFGERFYVDFTDPTPEDRAQKLQEFTQGVDKWITRNEIRESLNLEPIDGGDSLYTPLGFSPINAPPLAAEDNSQKIFKGRHLLKAKLEMIEGLADDLYKAFKKPKKKQKGSLLKDKTVRLQYELFVNKKIDKRAEKFKAAVEAESVRQKKRVLGSLKKGEIGAIDLVDYVMSGKEKALPISFDKKKENQIFAELAFPFLADAATESGQDALDLLGTGETFEYTAALEKKLKDRAKFFAVSINDTTLEKLSVTLAEGINSGEGITELSDRVSAVYDEFPTYRSDTIARTESTAANNEGFIEAYNQSAVVTQKEWVATVDERTRDSHLAINGEIVPTDQEFANGLMYPGDDSGDASETVNCRCVLAPVV